MASEVSVDRLDGLAETAREVRRDLLRMSLQVGYENLGESLAVVDLLTALVFRELHLDPKQPAMPDRDRLILTEGRMSAALHAALARRGYLPVERTDPLPRPDHRSRGPVELRQHMGVELSSAGPGQGIGMAIGLALDARLAQRRNRVYVIIGDSEARSGTTWEALLAGGQYGLDNLVVILNRNRAGSVGSQGAVGGIEPVGGKLRAFGYETLEIDGNDLPQVLDALARAKKLKGSATAILAQTVEGKGGPSLESSDRELPRDPTPDEIERAMAELGGRTE